MRHLKQSLALMVFSSFINACTFSQSSVAIKTQPLGNQQSSIAGDSVKNEINSLNPGQKGCDPNLTASIALPQLFNFYLKTKSQQAQEERRRTERAREVRQDNEYTLTGNEQGAFFDNPLVLNGQPLDYGEFALQSYGELTVIKKAPVTGQTIYVQFSVYLRRNGTKVSLPGVGSYNSKQMKVDLSEILQYAEPGDQLVIEAVRKEDGAIKRILKLVNYGC